MCFLEIVLYAPYTESLASGLVGSWYVVVLRTTSWKICGAKNVEQLLKTVLEILEDFLRTTVRNWIASDWIPGDRSLVLPGEYCFPDDESDNYGGRVEIAL